jgi:hypothetical protein
MMTALRVMLDEEFAPTHVAERMAVTIMKRMQQKGECHITDVEAMGFSRDQVARYWPDAWKIVEKRMPRPGRQ